jgi:hypothetical protein
MQNRICDLCSHPIQDLICASLDHSTPVIRFARSEMPIAKAIRWCNDPKNLRCAHTSCNSAKLEFTREEFFARGLNEREAPRFLTDGQLLELQFMLGVGGHISGRKHVESGHIQALGKKFGRIRGRKHVESGQITRIATPESCAKGGRASGRKHAENKTGIFGRSPEKMSADGRKGGRIGGRKHSESGHLARIAGMGGRRVHELHPELAAQNGRKNVDSGQIQALGKSGVGGRIGGHRTHELHPDLLAQNGRLTTHNRWHRNRGVSNLKCELCRAAAKSCQRVA